MGKLGSNGIQLMDWSSFRPPMIACRRTNPTEI
jgi:hypothetical protein